MMPESLRKGITAARASGTTLTAIAAMLNAQNVPPRRAAAWYASTVANVLKSMALAVRRSRSETICREFLDFRSVLV